MYAGEEVGEFLVSPVPVGKRGVDLFEFEGGGKRGAADDFC